MSLYPSSNTKQSGFLYNTNNAFKYLASNTKEVFSPTPEFKYVENVGEKKGKYYQVILSANPLIKNRTPTDTDIQITETLKTKYNGVVFFDEALNTLGKFVSFTTTKNISKNVNQFEYKFENTVEVENVVKKKVEKKVEDAGKDAVAVAVEVENKVEDAGKDAVAVAVENVVENKVEDAGEVEKIVKVIPRRLIEHLNDLSIPDPRIKFLISPEDYKKIMDNETPGQTAGKRRKTNRKRKYKKNRRSRKHKRTSKRN